MTNTKELILKIISLVVIGAFTMFMARKLLTRMYLEGYQQGLLHGFEEGCSSTIDECQEAMVCEPGKEKG